jgi:plastocyanin
VQSPRSVLFTLFPGVALLLAACGGGGSGSAGPTTTGAVAGAAEGGGAMHRVTATETEYRIQLSQTSLQPGTYTFVAVNKGKVAHSLEIDGPGVSDRRLSGTIPPGGTQSLTVKLGRGKYEIYCPVDGHKKLGMDTTIGVA